MTIPSMLTLPAELANLHRFLDHIRSWAGTGGFSSERTTQIELASEEVLVNICNYAYRQDQGDLTVTCRIDVKGRLIIQFIDQGEFYDPLSTTLPDVQADLDDREVGGLGLFLVKQLVNEVHYARENNNNQLQFIIHAPEKTD